MSIKNLKNSKIVFYKYTPRNISKNHPHQFWAGKIETVHINIAIEKNERAIDDFEYTYTAKFNPRKTKGYRIKKDVICRGKAKNIQTAQSKVKQDLSSKLKINVYLDKTIKYRQYPDFN